MRGRTARQAGSQAENRKPHTCQCRSSELALPESRQAQDVTKRAVGPTLKGQATPRAPPLRLPYRQSRTDSRSARGNISDTRYWRQAANQGLTGLGQE